MKRLRILSLLAISFSCATASFGADPRRDSVLIIRPELTERTPRIPGFIPRHFAKRPRIALILSGGGARGTAAIGVLQSFEQHHIPIDFIAGTSIGSIIGGLYASGYSPEQLQRLVDTTNWDEMMSLNDDARRREMFLDQKLAKDKSVIVLRFNGLEPILPESFSSGQRMTNFLNVLTLQAVYKPDPTFDALRVPFRAVTTDLVTGKRIVIDRGDLAEALRASMAIPLLFSSVRKDSLQLLDGGLVSNLPVEVAVENGYDIIVSVDMTSPLRPRSSLNAPWEIVDQITTIMMHGAKMIARERSDIVIAPHLGDHSSGDFEGLDSLIAAGRSSTDSVAQNIRDLLEARTRVMHSRDGDRSFHVVRWTAVEGTDSILVPQLVTRYTALPTVSESDLRSLAGEISEIGEFDDVSVFVRGPDDSAAVTISVRRYPTVRSLEINGAERVHPDTIRSILQPLLGRPLNVRLAEQYLDRILSVYRANGYALAKVQDVRFDSARGVATLNIEEGTIFYTTIIGTKTTRDWVIWRELPWKRGDVFRTQDASQAIANMYGTSLFEQVLVSARREGERREQNVVVINARERSTGLIRLGLRVDNDRNIQPSIDIREENFLGAGAEIGVMTAFGPRNQSLVAETRATRIFDSYFTFGLKGYYHIRDINVYSDSPIDDPRRFDRERVGEYRERRYGGSFSFGTQLERLGTFTVEGRIEQHILSNTYSTQITDQRYRISSIRLGTTIDTQDKFPFAQDGVALNLFYESALMKFVESIGFTKFLVSYERAHPVAQGHTLRPKIVLAVGDETLPLSEQFSLGGQTSFYGYPEDNARGRQLFVASLEYQYQIPLKLFFDTYFKARYDMGSTWLKPEEIRLEDMEHGLGVSIAFDTPVGPAEFSLGRSFYLRKDLLTHPLSWGPMMFYFSIGTPLVGLVERR